MLNFIGKNPNSINVFWCSAYQDRTTKDKYEEHLLKNDIIDLCNQKISLSLRHEQMSHILDE